MKILLTGSTGFLGGHLKRRLERDGHSLIYLRRGEYPHSFENERFNLVINCAAEVSKEDLMFDSNLYLTHSLLQVAKKVNSRFIQIGTSSETGPIEGLRSETTFCKPSNMYEATKLAATNLCLGYAGQHGMDVCVARPFSLYGSDENPRKMLPTLWRAFCDHRPFGCAPAGHDWIHVDDFVDGIVSLMFAPDFVTRGEIFHFGTGINTSNLEFVRLFEGAVGSTIDLEMSNTALKTWDVNDWRANWSKAHGALGWSPKIPLTEGINRFVNEMWFRGNRTNT